MLVRALFRSRRFIGANLLTLFLYSTLNGVLFFFPLNLIQGLAVTPLQNKNSLYHGAFVTRGCSGYLWK